MKKFITAMIIVLMLTVSVMPAFAVVSPEATEPTVATTTRQPFTYDVEVSTSPYGSVNVSVSPEGDKIHITPTPAPGYVFDHWVIEGDYDTDGKLTDEVLDLIAKGDLKIYPVYKKIDTGELVTGTYIKDVSQTSPKTGSNSMVPYAVIVLSLGACGVIITKLVKDVKSK